MIFLILSIISSSLIYIIFKLIGKSQFKLFHIIIINYLTAAITGFLIVKTPQNLDQILNADWFYISLVLGTLFFMMFYIIGLSTQRAGITITSIGTKMSLVFPMLFSILYYNEKIYSFKIIGMVLAILSIIFSSLKGRQVKVEIRNFIFPITLFIGMGLIDSLVKFNQEENLKNEGVIESSMVIFSVSAIIGLFIQILPKKKRNYPFNYKTIMFGIALGLSNFSSLYFMILALNSGFLDSSAIFAINNTVIIIISALTGNLLFKEELSRLNWLGVLLSLLAIISLSIII